ncbi:MAG: hypothetical protein AB7O67_03300 [Vicinamibacterales bacterium]
MTDTCRAVEAALEGVAAGDTELDVALAAHVDACPRCRERLALARAIDRALAARPVPQVPEGFTAGVLGLVRQERWRAEQVLDAGFNVAVAAGILLVAVGVAGLAWASGLAAVGGDMAVLFSTGLERLAGEFSPNLPVTTMAFLLATTAAGVWWWAEGSSA